MYIDSVLLSSFDSLIKKKQNEHVFSLAVSFGLFQINCRVNDWQRCECEKQFRPNLEVQIRIQRVRAVIELTNIG